MTFGKKIKRIAAAAVFALMTALLCSCIDVEVGMILRDDDSARVYFDVSMEEETLESMDMTPEEAAASLMEKMENDVEGWQTEPLTRTVGSKTYSGLRYYKDITSINVDSSGVFGGENETVALSVVKEGKVTKVSVKLSASASDESDADQMREMMNFRFRITPPEGATVVNTNGTEDADGTFYWDVIDVACGKAQSIEMTLDYEADGLSAAVVLIIVGIVVVLGAAAAVTIVLIKRNRTPALPKISLETYDMPAPEQNNNFVQPAAPVQPEPEREMAEVPEAPAEMPAAVMPAAPAKPAESSDSDEEKGYFQTSDVVKYCPACGSEAPADATFCSACGKALK